MSGQKEVLPLLMMQLLYRERPVIAEAGVMERVRRGLPRSEFMGGGGGWFGVAHLEYMMECKDGRLPLQTAVFFPDKEEPSAVAEEVLQQSWDWREAGNAVAECRCAMAVSELFGRGLEPAARLRAFNEVLGAILEVAPPAAVVSVHAGKVVKGEVVLERRKRAGAEAILYPHLNVRFFNISNSPGDMLMDTMGLATLGLPDLQCHYRKLDPKAVTGKLYDTACYLFEHGDVIENGHTLEGLQGKRWRCQHEDSLWPPKRVVLDVDPGDPYAAGGRKR